MPLSHPKLQHHVPHPDPHVGCGQSNPNNSGLVTQGGCRPRRHAEFRVAAGTRKRSLGTRVLLPGAVPLAITIATPPAPAGLRLLMPRPLLRFWAHLGGEVGEGLDPGLARDSPRQRPRSGLIAFSRPYVPSLRSGSRHRAAGPQRDSATWSSQTLRAQGGREEEMGVNCGRKRGAQERSRGIC